MTELVRQYMYWTEIRQFNMLAYCTPLAIIYTLYNTLVEIIIYYCVGTYGR